MTDATGLQHRLEFLARVVERETDNLLQTDQRLFLTAFSEARVAQMKVDVNLAEQVDAFVSRFGR